MTTFNSQSLYIIGDNEVRKQEAGELMCTCGDGYLCQGCLEALSGIEAIHEALFVMAYEELMIRELTDELIEGIKDNGIN